MSYITFGKEFGEQLSIVVGSGREGCLKESDGLVPTDLDKEISEDLDKIVEMLDREKL